MSDLARDYQDRLNLREQIARIDHQQAEIQKLFAEREKLEAEGHKYNRDPWVLVLAAIIAALATLFARLPELLTVLGVGK